MYKYILYLLIAILLSSNIYLLVIRNDFYNQSQTLFDKGIRKAFTYGWLTGANQMRGFGKCTVSHDTLMIKLKKDTSDFSYLMYTTN